MWGVGVGLMVAADAQKYYSLQHKRGLITTGMNAYTRNPNYLGEMLLYSAFAILARHWVAWAGATLSLVLFGGRRPTCACNNIVFRRGCGVCAVLAFFWTAIFFPNMHAKDKSLSRYPEWAAYKARTGMLLPTLGIFTDVFSATTTKSK